MNDFKIGDNVWFLYTTCGRNSWPDATIICPLQTDITRGKIVDMSRDRDNVYIYVEGETTLVSMGFTFFDEYVFKTNHELINAMMKRLQELKDE